MNRHWALKKFNAILFVASGVFLIGCSIFYYGYTQEEWNALSESEKRVAKEEYQRVMETKKVQEEETAINERAESFEDYGIKKTVP